MDDVFIFPNSLFKNNPLINKKTIVHIIEHPVFFTKYSYHKLKLILHRATMKYYADYIKKKYRCKIIYVPFNKKLTAIFRSVNSKVIHFYDPVDHYVVKHMKSLAKDFKKELMIHDTPLFLTPINKLQEFAEKRKTFTHNTFYIWQRKRLNILINKTGKPKGGKWTFDVKNRLPFPKNFKQNYKPKLVTNKYIVEAKKYIAKYFKNNPGSTDFYLPIDHAGTKKHFNKFIKQRLKCFGPYQDAVHTNIPFGCHSLLSPLMNIGLITPKYVIKNISKLRDVPIQSLEGYLRQVIGWREYCRLIYMFTRKELDNKNYFNHRNKLSKQLWYYGKGSSGMPFIDDMIKKTLKYAYLHHIERLMYIGNYSLITQTDPKILFRWFQSMNIDSYHVFMYPNVYGMSQHSAGPIMMKRPYFSSAAYIDKMSNYRKRKNKYNKIIINKDKNKEYEWFQVWDSLYYYFISKNKKIFSKNYALAAQVKHYDRKSAKDKQDIKKIAKEYMRKY